MRALVSVIFASLALYIPWSSYHLVRVAWNFWRVIDLYYSQNNQSQANQAIWDVRLNFLSKTFVELHTLFQGCPESGTYCNRVFNSHPDLDNLIMRIYQLLEDDKVLEGICEEPRDAIGRRVWEKAEDTGCFKFLKRVTSLFYSQKNQSQASQAIWDVRLKFLTQNICWITYTVQGCPESETLPIYCNRVFNSRPDLDNIIERMYQALEDNREPVGICERPHDAIQRKVLEKAQDRACFKFLVRVNFCLTLKIARARPVKQFGCKT